MAAEGDEERLPFPLPTPVRLRVVALAAEALGAMTEQELPPSLRPFRGFAPGRRARLAATPIAAALESDRSFRLRVSAQVGETLPDLAEAVRAGRTTPAADPVDVAAVTFLLRPAGWVAQLDQLVAGLRGKVSGVGTTRAVEQVAQLRDSLEAAQARARDDTERLRGELATARTEITDLRRRLGQSRQALREAEATAVKAQDEAATARRDADAATSAAETAGRRLRARLTETEAALETGRRRRRAGRAVADARVRLLLDTVVEAAQGLRRELALPPPAPDGPRPADLVAAVAPESTGVAHVAAQAREADDPALLDRLLRLPQVHLVVDGYNVTKLGYGSLPLQAQRERLVAGLASLAARSGAEITCCFDGAAVDAPVGGGTRAVRVLFSLPGESADELIRRLVAGEPAGRPVVVVSTDKEVADGVRLSGARPVPAAMLLRRLERD